MPQASVADALRALGIPVTLQEISEVEKAHNNKVITLEVLFSPCMWIVMAI
jgi:hypothetical protein